MLHPEQIKIYQAMAPQKKIAIATELFNAAWNLKFAAIKALHPGLSDEEIKKRVRRAFLLTRD